jgi:hypothetical protein
MSSREEDEEQVGLNDFGSTRWEVQKHHFRFNASFSMLPERRIGQQHHFVSTASF